MNSATFLVLSIFHSNVGGSINIMKGMHIGKIKIGGFYKYSEWNHFFTRIGLRPSFILLWTVNSNTIISSKFNQIACENEGKRNIKLKSIFNDPDIKLQWYLTRTDDSDGRLSHDLEGIWKQGITGKGVIVAIVESGVDVNHKDLRDSFNLYASYDFISNVNQITADRRNHATNMAGIVSAIANNTVCGTGVAPGSQFSNLIIYKSGNLIADSMAISKAFSYKNNDIHIYSNSWTEVKSFGYLATPEPLEIASITRATVFGRFHLGNIFIFAGGNTINKETNCAFNGYSQVAGVFTISSLTEQGLIPSYTQSCTSIVAATLSSEKSGNRKRLYTTSKNNSCYKNTGSTSASTALGAGILALLLQANKNLTVRQILYLIVTTSTQFDPNAIVNAAGYKYSRFIGFGLLNASSLIRESKSAAVITLPRQHKCVTTKSYNSQDHQNYDSYKSWIYSSGCYNFNSCVTRIEEVILNFSLQAKSRNHVNIFITSPSGTMVHVIESRPKDNSSTGFVRWAVKILTFYGEPAYGLWKIEVKNPFKDSLLKNWQLHLYGSCVNPERNVYHHDKVANFLCKNKIKIGIYMTLKLCLQRNMNLVKSDQDHYSFSKDDYPPIKYLMSI